MNNDRDILECWNRVMPNSPPRKSQLETFDWVTSLSPDIKYILLEMPVGGGKSPLGLTLSSYLSPDGMGSSYILTPQKVLQRQYEESFNAHILSSLYGKSNYKCHSKKTSCDVGAIIKPKCDMCVHRSAIKNGLASRNLVLNYTLALLLFQHIPDFKPRNLIVLDECHNLESQLTRHTEVAISEYMCKRIGDVEFSMPKNTVDAYEWVRDYYFSMLTKHTIKLHREVESISNYEHITKEMERTVTTYNALLRHANTVNNILLSTDSDSVDNDYVFIKGDKRFNIKELYARRAFMEHLEPYGERFLFMSSTILDKDEFCSDLGIDPKKAAFLSLDSEFDVENRGVIYSPQTKMNYGWDKPERKAGRTKMISSIKKILELHSADSGIIHTGSFKLSKWIISELGANTTHHILNHNPSDNDDVVKRDDIIKAYMDSASVRPTLLVSPSITEGLDLKDGLGRFAIFAKVPFPSLGDAWVKRRMELSDAWYKRQTLIEMIQGSGRICRSKEDYGITYILDASFMYLYTQTQRKFIPEWWDNSLDI